MSKTKIAGIVLAVIVVAGILIYVPFTLANSQNSHNSHNSQNETMQKIMVSLDDVPSFGRFGELRQRLLERFIGNATLAEVQGTVVALVRKLLVIEVDNSQVRVHLPREWIVEGKEVKIEDLFETDYLTIGQNITVKALEGTIVTKETFRIYVLVGYEMINADGIHAYAVLPFNIETP
jgi:hypothetical protein